MNKTPCSARSFYDVLIVGAGPAGLACAKVCAESGASVAVIEKRNRIGDKVCAGGITMHGLLNDYADILQRSFSSQRIVTRRQSATIKAKSALIATVSRRELGERMAADACSAGAIILASRKLHSIKHGEVLVINDRKLIAERIGFGVLVGADGSNSFVRRSIGLPSQYRGLGLNYQLDVVCENMEWHLQPQRFASGYAWIFPHKETTSVGAYCDCNALSARELRNNLNIWLKERGFDVTGQALKARMINFDYRGVEHDYCGNRLYLAGDAAGLASGLTGEGIYSAVVSGEYVGRRIVNSDYKSTVFQRLVHNHQWHTKAVSYTGRHPFLLGFLSEATCLLLRLKLLSYSAAELSR